ncbi:response regulator [Tardiphaga sp.]|uniref:response regulator n=1 Tax=Tardiphaga sp. TaxID=1926292 RepID=UPI00261D9AFB|nr:response regulator [Tardiphaga sp.]MDB5617294.1 Blue-light-activated histidine kinase [Tardiphaga sp.]
MTVRVLVVEDEAIIAIDIADQLTVAGFQVVGPVPSVAKALRLISEEGCDAAVLDVNLRDETTEAVALVLRSRGTPFLFLSAVPRDRLPSGFHDEVLLPKPVKPAILVAALLSSIAE